MKNEIEAMITDITATTAEAEDYTGEDGLLYCRLSRDDELQGDSNSIVNHDVMYRGWITPKNITS